MEEQSRQVFKISVQEALGDNPLHNAMRQLLEAKVIRVNRIVDMASQLLNLHVRWLLKEHRAVPKLDQNLLEQYLYAVSVNARGDTTHDREILQFRDTYYHFSAISREGIVNSLKLHARQMATDIKNNVAVRFWKRQWFCLKTEFPNYSKAELRALQQRIYNGEVRHFTMPARETMPSDKPMGYHVKANPHLFLPVMYEMLIFLDSHKCKLFALLPLRRPFIPSAILLDSTALYELTRLLPNEVMTPEVRAARLAFKGKGQVSLLLFVCCIYFSCQGKPPTPTTFSSAAPSSAATSALTPAPTIAGTSASASAAAKVKFTKKHNYGKSNKVSIHCLFIGFFFFFFFLSLIACLKPPPKDARGEKNDAVVAKPDTGKKEQRTRQNKKDKKKEEEKAEVL
jgi:hypothetical protein